MYFLVGAVYHENDGNVASCHVGCGRGDDERYHREPKRECNVPKSLSSLVRVPGVEEDGDDGKTVRGRRQQ